MCPCLGFLESLRYLGDQKVLKIEDVMIDDDVEKIRREFDAAKHSFLKIPQTLNFMPKMNPEGIYRDSILPPFFNHSIH